MESDMKKYNKLRFLRILFAAVLLLLNMPFAAIVSDNDGSAFVTKSEFEALKENFASQIENYNDSIDSKIDGAIANYLAGMAAKKELLQNNYADIEKNKKLKWISATDYCNTVSNSDPEYDDTHYEFYLSGNVKLVRKAQRAGRRSADNWMFDQIYYCSHIDDKVYVDSLRDLIPKFTFTDRYIFAAFSGLTSSTNSYEMASRTPDNYITGITLTNSMINHEYHGSGNLDSMACRINEDYYSVVSAIYIYDVASYTCETDKIYDDLILAPKSSSNTYYYQYDCKEACTDGGYYNVKWNATDAINWTASVTNNTEAISVSGKNYPQLNVKALNSWSNSKNIAVARNNVPWYNKKAKQKDLRYSLINRVTGLDYPIHYGILLTTISQDGTLSFKLRSDFAGQLVLLRADSPIADLATSTDTRVKKYNIGLTDTTIELKECEKNDNIYIVYVPTDTTKLASLTFGDLIFTPD